MESAGLPSDFLLLSGHFQWNFIACLVIFQWSVCRKVCWTQPVRQACTRKSPDNSSHSRAKNLAFWIGRVQQSLPRVCPEKGGEYKDLNFSIILGHEFHPLGGLISAPQIPAEFRRNGNWQRALPILPFLLFLIPAESLHSGIDTRMFPRIHQNGMQPESIFRNGV